MGTCKLLDPPFWLSAVMWLATILVFLFVLLLWKVVKDAPHKFPPGPWGLPVVGFMPFLTSNPAKKLAQLSRKYGEVLGVTIGSYHCVVLNSEKSIRKALHDDIFSGRPHFQNEGVRRILLGNGHEQREFLLRNLHGSAEREAKELVEKIKAVPNPVDLSQIFNAAVLNTLWAVVAGERMEHDAILPLVKYITSVRDNPICSKNFMPWVSRFFPSNVKGVEELTPFLKLVIEQHQSTYVPNRTRDLIDAYLTEIDSCTNPESSFYMPEIEPTLRAILLDLLISGTETTSTVLLWAILYVLHDTAVQTVVQSELDRVVGRSRLPSLKDRLNLPFTEATLMEVQRIAPVLPLAAFHSTRETTMIRGYRVPKGTIVIPNLYAALHDPTHWSDPDMFKPERFLSKDGTLKPDPHLIPFSTGLHKCIGQNLAQDSLFLFFAALLQNFTFTTVSVYAPDPNQMCARNVTAPNKFEVVIHERRVK